MQMPSSYRRHPRARLRHALAVLLIALLPLLNGCHPVAEGPAALTLAPLPWPMDALAPIISAETMALHYEKHHAGYVTKANELIDKSGFRGQTANEILSATEGKKKYEALFNNTAQAWNHAFFWSCLTPKGDARPTGPLAKAINRDFGGWTIFRAEFLAKANAHFGSGWVWLVKDGRRLSIITTANAKTPMALGLTPLFAIDLWEHAYYLDYQNRRSAYVEAVFDGLAHWKVVEGRYQR